MPEARSLPRVAIACQGGGSHTAFTAGVLRRVLGEGVVDVVALSGTSGGAVCALLAWHGLVKQDPDLGIELLERFWSEIAASDPWDGVLNAWLVGTSRLEGVVALPAVSPYLVPNWAQDRFRAQVLGLVPEEEIRRRTSRPLLLVGAVDVVTGQFRVFSSGGGTDGGRGRHVPLTSDAILASAAVPNLFRAVPTGEGGTCWDGLFSQNPPVRDLPDEPDLRPDEIWVVRINPEARTEVPVSVPDILDRRNELSGNLSLRQELDFIEKINELIAKGVFKEGVKYRPLPVRSIGMDADFSARLDTGSKLDRRPGFIAELMDHGDKQAVEFLATR
jgi:NTE family protein